MDIQQTDHQPIETQYIPLSVLYTLWELLKDVPCDENNIDTEFLGFPKGTPREEIWSWFEAANADFYLNEVMEGRHKVIQPVLILYGTIETGFTFVGPHEDYDEASRYDDNMEESGYIADLIDPKEYKKNI